MASAKKSTDTRVRTETVPVVVLTLDQDEADAIHAVLRNVGGDRLKGRQHADSVLKALSQAGVHGGSKYRINGALFFGGNPFVSTLSSF